MFLYQPTKGYAYNSDSIFLYQFIHRFHPKGKLLDVGCGVGIISLLLSRDFKIETTIIDKQKIMLQYAKHNYTINNLTVQAHHADFLRWKGEKEHFDYVVSNPPFYDRNVTQSQNEHLNIARYAQHLPIDALVQKVKQLLRPRGRFIFCYDAKQVDRVFMSLLTHKLNPEVVRFIHAKEDRDAKLVMISARLNSKSMTKVLPPLIVFDEASQYQAEALEAFRMAKTNSIKGDYDDE